MSESLLRVYDLSRLSATDGYAELLRATASPASTFGLMITPGPHGGGPGIESVLTVPWHNDAWLELTEPEYEALRAQLPESTWRVTPARDTITPADLTDELLDHLLDLSGRGDPGPWTSYIEGRNNGTGDSFIMVRDGAERGEDIYIDRDSGPADATYLDLIAAARTYLPLLVKELQQLRSHNTPGA